MDSTAIILAGGKSSRMGTNKALLTIDGKKVIERIVEDLKPIVNNMIIVTNSFEEYEFLHIPMVEDEWKGIGPLAGIHAGLSASQTQKNILVACDMPFISPRLGTILLDQLSDYEAVVPEISGQLHPLFAVYHRDIRDKIKDAIQRDQLRIRSIFNDIHVNIITETDLKKLGFQIQESALFNMNHPEEYEQAKGISLNIQERGRDK